MPETRGRDGSRISKEKGTVFKFSVDIWSEVREQWMCATHNRAGLSHDHIKIFRLIIIVSLISI